MVKNSSKLILIDKITRRVKKHGHFHTLFFILKRIPLFIISVLICFFVNLIRPFKLIRFGSLNSDKVGALVAYSGLYLLEKDNDIQPQNTLDIFHDGWGTGRHICNYQLLKMYKRVFSSRKGVYLSNGLVREFFNFASRNLLAKEHLIKTKCGDRDVLGLIEKSDIHLKFTEQEIVQAEHELSKMGIKKNSPYVCVMNRDKAYLTSRFPDRDWGVS